MARFPGWALVISRQQQRIEALERMVEALGDRLSNDPQLSGILHGMITSAAAIRATAAILAEADGADGGLDPAWRARFQRNLDEDAGTLATRARSLADYLEEAANIQREPLSHLDQLERFFAAHGWHFPAFEGQGGAEPGPGGENLIESLLDTAPDCALPARPFLEAARELHFDPAALAARFGCETGRVMRRLAFVPWDQAPARSGKAGGTPGQEPSPARPRSLRARLRFTATRPCACASAPSPSRSRRAPSARSRNAPRVASRSSWPERPRLKTVADNSNERSPGASFAVSDFLILGL